MQLGTYEIMKNIAKFIKNIINNNPKHSNLQIKLLILNIILILLFINSCKNNVDEQEIKHEFKFIIKYSNELDILTNVGDGRFIDFDNDGDLDVIITQFIWPPYPSQIHALKNDGNGSFEVATTDILGSQDIMMVHPRDFAEADFNGDNRQDLVIVDHGEDIAPFPGGQSKILMQSPNGSLSDETNDRFPLNLSFTHSVTVGDIDSDGDIDIYMGNIAGGTMPPCFYMNNGSGSFFPDITRLPTILTFRDELDLKYTSSLLLDVDNDGDLDLIGGLHGGYPEDKLFYERDDILLNNGEGFFTFSKNDSMPPRYKNPKWGTVHIASSDFNNDGFSDLLLAVNLNYCETGIQLLLSNGNGSFYDKSGNIPQDWPIGSLDDNKWIQWIFPIDLNNDGYVDFITKGINIKPKVFINNGEAIFQDNSYMLNISYPVTVILPGDLDNDGDIDLFVMNGSTYTVYSNQLQ